MRLTRDEWIALLAWINDHGYNRQPDEPLDQWRARTAPIAYQYALIVEAACDHVLSDAEPYCARCGMFMDTED